jgi:hypothetical protein
MMQGTSAAGGEQQRKEDLRQRVPGDSLDRVPAGLASSALALMIAEQEATPPHVGTPSSSLSLPRKPTTHATKVPFYALPLRARSETEGSADFTVTVVYLQLFGPFPTNAA